MFRIVQADFLAPDIKRFVIEAPRVASYSFPSSFAPFQYFPGRLAVEGRIDKAVRDALERIHKVDTPLGAFSFTSVRDAEYAPMVQIVRNGTFDLL